jgi:hypothetical protein
MRHFSIIILFSIGCCEVVAQEIIWDHSVRGVLRRAIRVPGPDFTIRNLEELSERIVKENSDELIDVRFVTERSQANLFPRPTHLLHSEFTRFHARLSKRQWQFASLISLGGRATLRIREGQNIFRRVLLEGPDPLIWTVNEKSFEIVYLSYSDHTAIKRINVFAVAQANFFEADCRQLYLMLESVLSKEFGYLAVRRDPWFMNDEFPILFWFHAGPPPSKHEVNTSSLVECARIDRTLSCSSYGVPKR